MVGDTESDMKAAAAAGVALRFLTCTGHGEKFAIAAAAANITLPAIIDVGHPLAAMLSPAALPLELHADLLSVSVRLRGE